MSDLNIYYEKEADLQLIKSRKVGIIGYGSQGHAHALNLQDNGVQVRVGLKPESLSNQKAKRSGLISDTVSKVSEWADVIMMLVPDEAQADVYQDEVLKHLTPGKSLVFAHGFNIHFGRIQPSEDIDVFMAAPKGPGHTVRSTFLKGAGVPALIAVQNDATGQAKDLALSYAANLGAGRAGIIETTFKDETETDLFGEQSVLCGGIIQLIKYGFETLTEAGYAPELAYFECLHEVKLIVDLLYEGGIGNMYYSVSNTAEYGGYVSGQKIIDESVKVKMRETLDRIRSGEFAREFVTECMTGQTVIKSQRRNLDDHPIEIVGEKLRAMMSNLINEKLVDKQMN